MGCDPSRECFSWSISASIFFLAVLKRSLSLCSWASYSSLIVECSALHSEKRCAISEAAGHADGAMFKMAGAMLPAAEELAAMGMRWLTPRNFIFLLKLRPKQRD